VYSQRDRLDAAEDGMRDSNNHLRSIRVDLMVAFRGNHVDVVDDRGTCSLPIGLTIFSH
jgi:hypothetical protein